MVDQLVKRYNEKGLMSGILVVSSVASRRPGAGQSQYHANKISVSYLAQALHYELLGRVDVIAYETGGVATKIIG